MELRHLRYFIAVAEEGSLTVAAEKRLHTSQPSLSRQIRDLEDEIGTPLFVRSVHGAELTKAGSAFLDHARLALAQVDAASDAARKAAKTSQDFAIGFLTGQEVDWLSEATRILAKDLSKIELTVSSQVSPELAEGVRAGRLDAAFMRAEAGFPELEYVSVATEKFVVLMPSDHRLASKKEIDVRELEKEIFIGASDVAGPMRKAIETYLESRHLKIEPQHRVHNITMAVSLIASTRGVALLPAYSEKFLPWSVISRPLKGSPPKIDLVVGYKRTNQSPILASFIKDLDQIKKN